MSSGNKPKQIQASTYKSSFAPVKSTSFGSDFGTGTSSIDPTTGQWSTSSSLSPGLKQVADSSTSGLNNNINYLNQDPSQRFASIAAGQDPTYNAIQTQSQRQTDQALGRAQVDAQSAGNLNSTALGAQLGAIHNDDILRTNTNQANAYTLGNQTATNNANTLLGSLTGMGNLSYPLATGANSNLTTANQSIDTNGQFNAQQQQQAQIQNQNLAMQQQAQHQALIGSLVNAAATIGGAAIGGPLGGAIGSKLGGMVSNGMSGGSGGYFKAV